MFVWGSIYETNHRRRAAENDRMRQGCRGALREHADNSPHNRPSATVFGGRELLGEQGTAAHRSR